ncbi:CHAT domain-containing tetratricopeptide repeat protein [Roseimaritima sediminicola]|uniref:CHAT domain-containing tetratricopeptide repeat protein n=1 Tax=Roseimaritima sediminicola TaxID=2662066 RepID=UPI001386C141|nr:tetratricopeptide repeat protein [Roseimaritima sediminicola]
MTFRCVTHASLYFLMMVLLNTASLSFADEPPSASVGNTNFSNDVELAERFARRNSICRESQEQFQRGNFDTAMRIMETVLELDTSLFGDVHEVLIGTHNTLANIANAAEDWAGEIHHRQHAFIIAQQLFENNDYRLGDLKRAWEDAVTISQLTAESRHLLQSALAKGAVCQSLSQQGRYAESLGIASESLDHLRSILGNEHPVCADRLFNIAGLLVNMSDYERAESFYLEASTVRAKVLGKEHPHYATGINGLATLYLRLGDYDLAEPLCREVLGIRGKVLGKKHADYAASVYRLANLYGSTEDHAQAVPLYREALAFFEKEVGSEHPLYVDILSKLAGSHVGMGDYSRAATLHHEVLATRRKVLGIKHSDCADSLNSLAGIHYRLGEYSEAELRQQEAMAILEKALGKEHPQYAASMSNMANIYMGMGKYARATLLQQQALAITERELGKEHPNYITGLLGLAELCFRIGDYPRAKMLWRESLALADKTTGQESRQYCSSLEGLASVYKKTGEYAQAATLHQQVLVIRGRLQGKGHPDYAVSLAALAQLYHMLGDYLQAEPLYREALAIQDEVLGRKHPAYARSLNGLALLFDHRGDCRRADPLYREAMAILEEAVGKVHSDYANCLNDYAGMQQFVGNYRRAELLLQEALSIQEEIVGKEHSDYAVCLSNLAGLYVRMGNYRRAEALFREALGIVHAVLGKGHYSYAFIVHDMAELCRDIGDYGRSVSLFKEALAARERLLGDMHPLCADTMSGLAGTYFKNGDFNRAEPLFCEALAIHRETFGPDHPTFAVSLSNLAALYYSMSDFPRAKSLYERAIDVTIAHIEDTSLVLSEQQQLAMGKALRYQLDGYLRCCLDGNLAPRAAISRSVAWKGATLVRQRALRKAAADPAIAGSFSELRTLAQRLSALSQSVPGPEGLQAWNNQLAELVDQKEKLERSLMQKSAAFREAEQRVALEDIEAALPDNAVLVDYLEFAGPDGPALLAAVIRAGAEPVLLSLGSATRAEESIVVWRQSYGVKPTAEAAGQMLRDQLWEPLRPYLDDCDLVMVSTDGVLGRLPLAALPGSESGTYLIEDHRLVTIPVPQLLPVLVRSDLPRLERDLLLMGDIDYEESSEQLVPQAPSQTPRQRRWNRSGLPRAVRGEKNWKPLTETRNEVEFIGGLYRRLYQPGQDAIVDLRQAEATESAFIAYAPRSMFVHLATHGFFAAPQVKSTQSPKLIAGYGRSGSLFYRQRREMVRGFSPGQLSGLVFAGANDPPPIDPFQETSPDDGILTADEIASLPMEGVRLIVLSACETGLGEVAGGEGLLGIQRGFQVAGARSTVASLWKVNDAATRRLMQEFYTNYLDKEMSLVDALREAQLWAIRNPGDVPRGDALVFTSAKNHEPARLSPQFWAAFVLSGDWR